MNVDVTSFSPSLVTSAHDEALQAGRRNRRLIALRLILVTAAALFGALTIASSAFQQDVDYAGIVAVSAFLAVLGIRLTMSSDRLLEDAERRGSATAELANSHAWRYAVGARPYTFTIDEEDCTARSSLLNNLRAYQKIMLDYSWTTADSTQITSQMFKLRHASLSDRRESYLRYRINPLFIDNTNTNRSVIARSRRLTTLTLLVELVGVPAGVVKAIALSNIDLLSVTAAAAASLALWHNTLRLPQRARSTATTCLALASASDVLQSVQSEYEWAAMVAKIEEQLTLNSEAALASDTARYLVDEEIEEATTMTPEAYFAAAEELKRQIWEESDRLPKLEPDVIVGVNPGGAIIGGMLYFMTRASDFFPLSFRSGLTRRDIKNMVDAAPWQSRRVDRLSILIVDASMKSGDSLRDAVELVRTSIEGRGWRPAQREEDAPMPGQQPGQSPYDEEGTYVIRTAVITKKPVATEPDTRVTVDYFVDEVTEHFPYGSI